MAYRGQMLKCCYISFGPHEPSRLLLSINFGHKLHPNVSLKPVLPPSTSSVIGTSWDGKRLRCSRLSSVTSEETNQANIFGGA